MQDKAGTCSGETYRYHSIHLPSLGMDARTWLMEKLCFVLSYFPRKVVHALDTDAQFDMNDTLKIPNYDHAYIEIGILKF